MSEVFGTTDNLPFQMGIRHTFISRAKCVFGTNSFPVPNAFFGTVCIYRAKMRIWYRFIYRAESLFGTIFIYRAKINWDGLIYRDKRIWHGLHFRAKRNWHIFIRLSKRHLAHFCVCYISHLARFCIL